MKKIKLTAMAVFVSLALAAPAMAHTMWINLFRSSDHLPGHALVTLGWGHSLPLDDLLASPHAVLKLAKYELVDPDAVRTDLSMPVVEMDEGKAVPSGIVVQSGDLGVRKLVMGDGTKPGTYQVAASSKETYFTSYIDKNGKRKMDPIPIDEIEKPQKIMIGMKFNAYAKSYTTVKEWTTPKPLGFDLEIMPKTDLTRVRVGDIVPFEVTFLGKPVNRFEGDAIQYITATSSGFGGPDGFFLSSYLTDGKGQFRMPAAGQWMVNVYFKEEVNGNERLKAFADKCTVVYCAATVSFNVNP